jgi:hypothetical protein
MATSPIYNWPEPDNTDLVKNGALAIRTLGDAIDTTMGTMVPKSIVDAKGDLIAGTAADTTARLAVGANDLLLTAASGEATGLKYTGGWTSYTPTFTNFTLGNGTVTAKYCKIGKVVFVHARIVWGSTTSTGSYPIMSLPVNSVTSGYFTGTADLQDAGTTNYMGKIYIDSATGVWPSVDATGGTYAGYGVTGPTIPMTWTTNDGMIYNFYYEAV